jgi:hypothetical protein
MRKPVEMELSMLLDGNSLCWNSRQVGSWHRRLLGDAFLFTLKDFSKKAIYKALVV